MKIIDINNIEELIIFKYESEKLSKTYTNLEDFIQKYTNLQKIYVTKNNETIPFDIFTFNGVKVIFACFENNDIRNTFVDKLNSINFNLDKLSEVSIENQLSTIENSDNINDIFFINNKMYR